MLKLSLVVYVPLKLGSDAHVGLDPSPSAISSFPSLSNPAEL